MTDGPTIPQVARLELCQAFLKAQDLCLQLFDAIEAGDLTQAVVLHMDLFRAIQEPGNVLRVYAALELADLEKAMGRRFGDRQ